MRNLIIFVIEKMTLALLAELGLPKPFRWDVSYTTARNIVLMMPTTRICHGWMALARWAYTQLVEALKMGVQSRQPDFKG